MYPYSHTISVPDFWKLAAASRLLSVEQCQQLTAEYVQSVDEPAQRECEVPGPMVVEAEGPEQVPGERAAERPAGAVSVRRLSGG